MRCNVINISIPGKSDYSINNIVFDYNGTLAENGKISASVREKLLSLCGMADVYVLTADTYGSATGECRGINLTLKTFPTDNASDCKAQIVDELGRENTVCFGNGFNDIKMFKSAALSVAVLAGEGMCSALLISSDVMVRSIEDGMNLLLNPNALRATLRG